MRDDGLTTFRFHMRNPADREAAQKLTVEHAVLPAFTALTGENLRTPSPEAAARLYLDQVLASPAVPTFTAPALSTPDGRTESSDFQLLESEQVPFTNTRLVKFTQTFHGVPVYGAMVSVELDEGNGLVSIDSALGQPTVGPNPTYTADDAAAVVRARAGHAAVMSDHAPYLAFYHDEASTWRLVYVFDDVQPESASPTAVEALGHAHTDGAAQGLVHPVPLCFDYLVDAHRDELIAELPRTSTMTLRIAPDELGANRTFRVRPEGTLDIMHDDEYNVHTYDADFFDLASGPLPTTYCSNPPPWQTAAVSAHANARVVAAYVQRVLGRRGVDNRGGPLVSHVNCVDGRLFSADGKVWPNAAWFRNQMVYGQRYDANGVLRSYAASLDVVAHEVFHGVTGYTARLEYRGETGALNESYSDIFGILVSNAERADRASWNWQLGEELGGGVPLRDLSAPRTYRQPDHMWDYAHLPLSPAGDYGGVHVNSGIHNKAAHLIMTAIDAEQTFLFTADQLAQLFYLALLRGLTPTSRFRDSRDALVQAAYSLFGINAEVRADAIRQAFATVGILEPAVGTVPAAPPAATGAGGAAVAPPGVPVQGVVVGWDANANRGVVHLLVNGAWTGRATATLEEFAALSAVALYPTVWLNGGALYGRR